MRGKTLAEFQADLLRFADDEVPEMFRAVQRKIAFDVFRGIVEMTPVDTGRARGNWRISFDVPDDTVDDSVDKWGGATIAKAVRELNVDFSPQQVIWISNSLPYIEALEDGHSQEQAPQGMVAVTLNALGLTGARR